MGWGVVEPGKAVWQLVPAQTLVPRLLPLDSSHDYKFIRHYLLDSSDEALVIGLLRLLRVSTGTEHFRTDFGMLTLIGPRPPFRDRTCVSGQTCIFESLLGPCKLRKGCSWGFVRRLRVAPPPCPRSFVNSIASIANVRQPGSDSS